MGVQQIETGTWFENCQAARAANAARTATHEFVFEGAGSTIAPIGPCGYKLTGRCKQRETKGDRKMLVSMTRRIRLCLPFLWRGDPRGPRSRLRRRCAEFHPDRCRHCAP